MPGEQLPKQEQMQHLAGAIVGEEFFKSLSNDAKIHIALAAWNLFSNVRGRLQEGSQTSRRQEVIDELNLVREHYMDDMSYEQLAGPSEVSKESPRIRVQRGISVLRRGLEDESKVTEDRYWDELRDAIVTNASGTHLAVAIEAARKKRVSTRAKLALEAEIAQPYQDLGLDENTVRRLVRGGIRLEVVLHDMGTLSPADIRKKYHELHAGVNLETFKKVMEAYNSKQADQSDSADPSDDQS